MSEGVILRRVLGLDYGSQRIGVAVSDPMRIIAKGVGVVLNTPAAIEEIRRMVVEYDVEKIVVGMPFNLKGEQGQKALQVNGFIELMRKALPVEVVTWDERFTSHTAHQTLITLGVKKNKRRVKGTIDEMAAAIILQSYLDRKI